MGRWLPAGKIPDQCGISSSSSCGNSAPSHSFLSGDLWVQFMVDGPDQWNHCSHLMKPPFGRQMMNSNLLHLQFAVSLYVIRVWWLRCFLYLFHIFYYPVTLQQPWIWFHWTQVINVLLFSYVQWAVLQPRVAPLWPPDHMFGTSD